MTTDAEPAPTPPAGASPGAAGAPPAPELSSGKKAAFALVLLGIVLLIAEVGARLYEWRKTERRAAQESPIVPVTDSLYLLNPGWEGVVSGQPARINALGMRGADAAREKRPGTTRIICVGDSCTFGFGNGPDSTYPVRLAAELAARGKDDVEVLNAGIYGYDSARALLYVSSYLLELRPDYVIVMVGWNDVPAISNEDPRVEPALQEPHAFFDHTGIGRRLRRLAHNLVKERDADARALAEQARSRENLIRDAAVENHRKNLAAIARACRAAGATPVFAPQPHFLGAGDGPVELPDEALAKCLGHLVRYQNLSLSGHREVAKRLAQNARDVAAEVDGSLLIETDALHEHEDFYDLVHATDAGQGKLARIIADALAPRLP